MEMTEIKARLEFWKSALVKLRSAYLALVDGGIRSYKIGDRELSKIDLPDLKKEIEETEQKIDALNALVSGKKPRKVFGVVPRDF